MAALAPLPMVDANTPGTGRQRLVSSRKRTIRTGGSRTAHAIRDVSGKNMHATPVENISEDDCWTYAHKNRVAPTCCDEAHLFRTASASSHRSDRRGAEGENGDYNGTFSKLDLEAAGAVAQQTSLSVFSDLDLGGASKSASRFLHVFAMLNLDYPRSAVGQAPIKIFSC